MIWSGPCCAANVLRAEKRIKERVMNHPENSDRVNRGHDGRVFVVDDDDSVREAIGALLESVDIEAECFASTLKLLERLERSGPVGRPNCLILDIRMPGFDGLELQKRLTDTGINIPIIFVSAFGDVSMTVQAMKAGAHDFLAKPFRDQHLLDSVHCALAHDRARRQIEQRENGLRERYASLTDRERKVLELASRGLLNKQIAWEMNLSEITIKVHRAQLMRKMSAKTFADLVRMEEHVRDLLWRA
jgi:FixJ family two-component response regulator